MKHKLPIILFSILLAVTLILCGTVFFLWYSGRQAMTNEVIAPQLPPRQEGQTEASLPEEAPDPLLQSHIITRDGVRYQYNKDMCNILLIGIDGDRKPEGPLPYGNSIQADVLVLAAMDLKNRTLDLIALNRDTMCSFATLDKNGQPNGTAYGQLALSYSCGDGLDESCRLTADAVSSLFYGLQIHGYGAYFLGGIPALNDALGGVTVTVLDDFPFTDWIGYEDMYPGNTVTLTGPKAQSYIQSRLDTEDGNLLRMRRQKQYMMALIQQAKEKVVQQPSLVLDLYQSLSPYLLTDLSLSRITYLASQAVDLDISLDLIQPVGTIALGQQNHMELTLDEDALYDLILDIFYEEVPS